MTGTLFLLRTDAAPIPDLSKIAGEPNAPADTTTNFEAATVTSSLLVAPGRNAASVVYSIPTARLFL